MRSSRLFESGITGFLKTGRRGPTPVMQAMLCAPAKAVTVAVGKVEAVEDKKAAVGDSAYETLKTPTRTVVASAAADGGDGSSAEVNSVSTPVGKCHRCAKKGHWNASCTVKLCIRCQRQRHTADAYPTSVEKRCGRCNGRGCTCPSSKEETVLAVASEVGARTDDCANGAVQISVFKTEESGERSDGSGRMWEGELAW